MKTKKWELKDIIMMAILGVVFSAVYLAVFDGGLVLSTVLTPLGLSNFAFELIYGVWFMAGAEVVFALFRYKKWNLLSMSLAGMLSAVFIFIYELFYLNYIALAPTLLISQLAVRFVSAVFFSGLICKLAGDALAKTGVVKSYAIGAKADIGKVYDEEEE